MSEQRADNQPYGDVPYADPGYQADKQKRYPIDTEAHVRAAWSYINMPKNASQYTASQLNAIKARIVAAAHKFGIEISSDSRAATEVHETRDLPGVIEIRRDGTRIGGYGAVFNRDSRPLPGGFVERVESRAFENNQSRDWQNREWQGVVSRFNHNPDMLLGSTAAGTLFLRTDDVGLDYEVLPPPSRRDIMDLVERRDIRFSSFEFRMLEEDWKPNELGVPVRTLLRVQLYEVGPVATPAYVDTTAALRSLANHFNLEYAEIERLAAANELRGLFMRTDVEGQSKPRSAHFGPAVKMALLARRKDPWLR